MVLAAILKRNFFFKFCFSNVYLFMSYFEPNFIVKFFRESDFSNFGDCFRGMEISILVAILKR